MILLEIGAVDFLTQLRASISDDVHRSIDAILDNLFHLPTTNLRSELGECTYRQDSATPTASSRRVNCLPQRFLRRCDSDAALTESDLAADLELRLTTGNAHYTSVDEQQVGYFEASRHEAQRPVYSPQTIPGQCLIISYGRLHVLY